MRLKLSFFCLIITLVLISGCATIKMSDTSFTDTRDGRVYTTARIGNLIWMLENLNYDIKGSYCYDDKTTNCNAYGKLYTYGAAFDACPPGWRLPTEGEMKGLIESFGSNDNAADILLKPHPQGFNLSYAGSRYYSGEYAGMGEYIVLWTSSDVDNEKAICFSLDSTGDKRITWPEYLKTAGFSVRCVRKAY